MFHWENKSGGYLTKEGESMDVVRPTGVWTCVVACSAVCGSGCFYCLADGAIFIADTATGGTALASGLGAGATT